MAFLLLNDYLELITQFALDEITDSDMTRVSRMELEAIGQMKSYLQQRYNVDVAFADMNTFSLASVYNVGNRIIWTQQNYSAQSTWTTSNVSGAFNSGELITANNGATGQLVGLIGANTFIALTGDWTTATSITGNVSTQTADIASVAFYAIGDMAVGSDGNIYQAIANTLLNPVTNPSDWGTALAANNSLYYNIYPAPPYNGNIVYQLNEQVVFMSNVYKATRTVVPGFQPLRADGTVNTDYWSLVSAAGTTTGVLPTDATKWAPGDNRDQQLVQHCVDICLYHLHARINPRNIPDLRKQRYDGDDSDQKGGAIGWLKMVAAGKINANIPERYEFGKVPGVSISYGNSSNLRAKTGY